jgi:type VI secretion system VgrG family protein
MSHAVRFGFESSGFPAGAFRVAAFSGHEALSRLYRFDIDLVCDMGDLDIEALYDTDCRLVIAAGEHRRTVHGILAGIQLLERGADHHVLRVSLVPRAWGLTRSRAHAVHLDRSVPDVVGALLEERLGLTRLDVHYRLSRHYRAKPFRMQHGESDWDFLCALMEEEGIYYFFADGGEAESVCLCDDTGRQPEARQPALEYIAAAGMSAEPPAGTVHALAAVHERVPAHIELRNYHDERPSEAIHAHATVDERGMGTVTLYGEDVATPQEAEALAQIRAEEQRCRKVTHDGEGTACQLAPGMRFAIRGVPQADGPLELQVLSIEHRGQDPEVCGRIARSVEASTPVYENRFRALPGDAQFRPARETRRPRIHGTVDAHIDAEGDGLFAEPDAQGRYRVIFPFDPGFLAQDTHGRAGKASHWLRLLQPYGGHDEGMHFPLRRGARVLVGFLDGHPDRPVIIGTLPNAHQPSPLRDVNLGCGSIRTPSGNRLEMDDAHPGIRLASPTAASYLRLGAQRAGGSGGQTGNPKDSSQGIVSKTEGLSLWTGLGGVSMQSLTDGWIVDTDAWPLLTRDARDAELGAYTLNGVSQNELETEWSITNAIEKIFAFPKKHHKPQPGDPNYRPVHDQLSDDDQRTLTEDDELSNLIHTTRHIGETYQYQSGTDFTFHGPQRESFDFGPLATYTSWDHDTDANALRRALMDTMEGFGGEELTLPDQGSTAPASYDSERQAYENTRAKRVRLEALLVLVDNAASAQRDTAEYRQLFAGELTQPGEDFRDAVDRIANHFEIERAGILQADPAGLIEMEQPGGRTQWYALATDYRDAVSGAILQSFDADDVPPRFRQDSPDQTKQAFFERKWSLDAYRVLYRAQVAAELQRVFEEHDDAQTRADTFAVFFYDARTLQPPDLTDSLNALDPQRPGSATAQRDFLESMASAYGVERMTYSLAWERAVEAWIRSGTARIRNGRMSVLDADSLTIQRGSTFRYSVGPQYSETHLEGVDHLAEPDDRGRTGEASHLGGVVNPGAEHDLADAAGPGWKEIRARVGDDWLPDRVGVTKTFGKTYTYHHGDAASVQVGDRHSVEKLDRIREEHLHPRTGAVIALREGTFGIEGHEAGWHEFATNHIPKVSLTTNLVGRTDTTINAGGCMSTTLNMLGVADTTVNVGGVANTTLNLAGTVNVEVSAGPVFQFLHATNHVKCKGNGTVNAELGQMEADINANRAMLRQHGLELSQSRTELDNVVARVERTQVALRQHGVDLTGGLEIFQGFQISN